MKGELVKAEFVEIDGKLVWREEHHARIKDTGVMYVAWEETDDPDRQHLVYHLHGIDDCEVYRWRGIWNSCVQAGNGSTSIEEMIRQMLDKPGWRVACMGISEFSRWFFNRTSSK